MAQQAWVRRLIGRANEGKHAKRKKRGKRASVDWSSTRPDRAYLYANEMSRAQVFYETKVS
jgi:hypothetical protein